MLAMICDDLENAHIACLANGIACLATQGRCVALNPIPLWTELVRSSKPFKLDLKMVKSAKRRFGKSSYTTSLYETDTVCAWISHNESSQVSWSPAKLTVPVSRGWGAAADSCCSKHLELIPAHCLVSHSQKLMPLTLRQFWSQCKISFSGMGSPPRILHFAQTPRRNVWISFTGLHDMEWLGVSLWIRTLFF